MAGRNRWKPRESSASFLKIEWRLIKKHFDIVCIGSSILAGQTPRRRDEAAPAPDVRAGQPAAAAAFDVALERLACVAQLFGHFPVAHQRRPDQNRWSSNQGGFRAHLGSFLHQPVRIQIAGMSYLSLSAQLLFFPSSHGNRLKVHWTFPHSFPIQSNSFSWLITVFLWGFWFSVWCLGVIVLEW